MDTGQAITAALQEQRDRDLVRAWWREKIIRLWRDQTDTR